MSTVPPRGGSEWTTVWHQSYLLGRPKSSRFIRDLPCPRGHGRTSRFITFLSNLLICCVGCPGTSKYRVTCTAIYGTSNMLISFLAHPIQHLANPKTPPGRTSVHRRTLPNRRSFHSNNLPGNQQQAIQINNSNPNSGENRGKPPRSSVAAPPRLHRGSSAAESQPLRGPSAAPPWPDYSPPTARPHTLEGSPHYSGRKFGCLVH